MRIGRTIAGLLRTLRRLSRRLWVRVGAMGSLAVFAVAASQILGGFLGKKLAETIGSDALDRLLDILATSMLTVTTFSLTVMVSVYRASSQQFTPRAHRELLKDTRTQTALATFIGAYLYALVAIVLSERPDFSGTDEAALYLTTLLVLALIVGEMILWMIHLQNVGSLMHVAAGIESEAETALQAMHREPWTRLGRIGGDDTPGRPVRSTFTGYVQALNPEPLIDAADEAGARVHLRVAPGSFVDTGDVIATIEGGDAGALDDAVQEAIHFGALRTTEQDPRFALILLSELGSKALSPGINDPGTAIDVLGRIARILDYYHPREVPVDARVTVPLLDPATLIENGFEAIARDGASLAEVQLFLQKRLAHLMDHPDRRLARAAEACARRALGRTKRAMDEAYDYERVAAESRVRE